jgi:hypothetical protein
LRLISYHSLLVTVVDLAVFVEDEDKTRREVVVYYYTRLKNKKKSVAGCYGILAKWVYDRCMVSIGRGRIVPRKKKEEETDRAET